MAPKPVRYTRHARERMALRKITEDMVCETLEHPENIDKGYLGRSLACRSYPPGMLKVVYSERPDAIVVITTIWG